MNYEQFDLPCMNPPAPEPEVAARPPACPTGPQAQVLSQVDLTMQNCCSICSSIRIRWEAKKGSASACVLCVLLGIKVSLLH